MLAVSVVCVLLCVPLSFSSPLAEKDKVWSRLPPLPEPLFAPALVYDTARHRLLVHGGLVPGSASASDRLYQLAYPANISTSAWRVLGTGGVSSPSLYGHVMQVVGGKAYVAGGLEVPNKGRDGQYSQLYVLDLKTHTWSNPDRPMTAYPNLFGASSRDSHDVWVHGGIQGVDSGRVEDPGSTLFSFDVESGGWTQHVPNSDFPVPRFAGFIGALNDTTRVIYGGGNGQKTFEDMVHITLDTRVGWIDVPVAEPRPTGVMFMQATLNNQGDGPCKKLTDCFLIVSEGYALDGSLPGGLWRAALNRNPIRFEKLGVQANADMPPPLWGAASTLTDINELVVVGGATQVSQPYMPDISATLVNVSAVSLSLPIDATRSVLMCADEFIVHQLANCSIAARSFAGLPSGSPLDSNDFSVRVSLPNGEVATPGVTFDASQRLFRFSFSAGVLSGAATVDAFFKGARLRNAPLNATVGPAEVDPRSSVIKCPEMMIIDSTAECTILTKDRFGNPSGTLEDSSRFAALVQDCNNYTQHVSFRGTGRYSLDLAPSIIGWLKIQLSFSHVALGDGHWILVKVIASNGCPIFEEPNPVNLTECVCSQGFEPRDGGAGSDKNGCQACPAGMRKDMAGDLPCYCAPGFYNMSRYTALASCHDLAGFKQYPTPPLPPTGNVCGQAPSCATSPGPAVANHSTRHNTGVLEVEPGFWTPDRFSGKYYKCASHKSCPGMERAAGCEEGYTGPMCSLCEDGWTMSSGNGGLSSDTSCSKCADQRAQQVLVSLAFVLGAVGFISFMIWSAKQPRSFRSLALKVLLNWVQVTSLLGSFRQTVSQSLRQMFSVFGRVSGNRSVYSIGCVATPDLLDAYVVTLVVVIALSAPLVLAWMKRVAVGSKSVNDIQMPESVAGSSPSSVGQVDDDEDDASDAPRDWWTLYLRAYLVLIFFVFPFVVLQTLEILGPCVSVGELSYLAADLSISCHSDRYHSFAGVAGVVAAACVLVPLVLTLYTRKHVKQDTEGEGHVLFLVSGFRSNSRLWEFVILMRKLIVASLSVFLVTNPIAQAFAGAGVINGFLGLQLIFNPFDTRILNVIETTSLVVTNVTLIFTGFLDPRVGGGSGAHDMITALLLVLNVGFLLVMVYLLASDAVTFIKGKWQQRQLSKSAAASASDPLLPKDPA